MISNIRIYQTAEGRQPFKTWIEGLKDIKGRAKIQARLARIELGNFGDSESVGEGVVELRIDFGPGYRVYLARIGQVVVLLLCGGDKSSQAKDINLAKEYFSDYQKRTRKTHKQKISPKGR